jgi:hypothetical protein
MLILRKRFRAWAAGLLVVAYAFGVLSPSLAFAFDGHASIVPSVTETHGGMLAPHIHHHDEAEGKNSGQHPSGGAHHCCGVLALPGLPPPAGIFIAGQMSVSLVSPAPEDHHTGCGPVRLERPPRPSFLI